MVELKMIEVPEKVFDYILEEFSSDVIIEKEIWNMFCGTPDNKKPIYTDGTEWLVCQEYILDYASQQLLGKECILGCTDWKQVRVRKAPGTNHIQLTYNGSYCYNYLMRVIKKYYAQEEIEQIFLSHSEEYDPEMIQRHDFYDSDAGELIDLENCYKYDINGAHAYALINLFPLAKAELLKIYKKKDSLKAKGDISGANKIKALFNYFVGMLCKKGYRGTYNYIVHSITRKVNETEDYLDGILVYANTDSICVMNPKKTLEDSKALGEFKLEGKGEMYVYRDTNYWLLEYTDTKGKTEQVGSCKLAVRDKVSLKDRRVVHYRATRELIGVDKNGSKHYKETLYDIREEQL